MTKEENTPSKPPAATGLVHKIMADVRGYIHENNLMEGDMIPSETSFAEKGGVSRTIAREAFRALAAIGILDIGNGRRARVGVPNEEVLSIIIEHTVFVQQLTLKQILETRRTLELRGVELAAQNRTDAEALELLSIAASMEKMIDDDQAILEYDIQFHQLIASASRNPLYSLLINSFRDAMRQTWHIGWYSRQSRESKSESIMDHKKIAGAIASQDSGAAEAAMMKHFDEAITLLIQSETR
ncbi:FadR/GntR family transcriptional regulator [uncultured Cohaesibacter sp.]|uniref:FadR/GntR family transcriptional regulator n=1 Tax=uncultured Cohaesibacter sp. TaxID=1002546 RepID=UPI00293108BD|nr:FadR/GntR family transcriptional regulator [uncultured Cohaesibacter sp.]